MTFAYTPYILPFVASSMIIVILWLFTFQYRHESSARAFLGLLIAVFIWSTGFIFEILGVELETKILFANIQFLGITAIPIAFLTLIIEITGRGQKLRHLIYFLEVFFLIANTIIWTDSLHHWFRISPHVDTTRGPFPILVNTYGFWFYYVQTPIYYLIHFLSLVIIVQAFIFSSNPYRSQAGILLMSFILPLLVDGLYIVGITPIRDFNFSSAALSISGILIAFALFQYRLFDIVPMANDLIVNNFSAGVVVLDPLNRIIEINPRACRIVHANPKEAIGKPLADVLWFANELVFDPNIEQRNVTIQHSEPDGVNHYYDVTTTVVKNRRDRMAGTLITIRDVTERQRMLMEARILATTDPLTGAYNRRHFFESLETELARAYRYSTPLAVIMFDIDDFKQFNDKYGHSVGDEILIMLTKTCQAHLRNFDLLCRYGGDEFVILLPQTNSTLAVNVADRLCQLISDLRIAANGDLISITASIGVAAYNGQTEITPDKLMQLADDAMYQAKGNEKNQVAVINFEDKI